MWYKQNYVPHVPQMWYKMWYILWYKLGCMGENQYKYRKYVPQNVVQNVVQTRVHGGQKSILKISQQSLRMKIRKIFRCKKRGAGGQKLKNNLKYLKTRVFGGFLDENPKIENF